jgi:uncharacterized protein YjbI with pentapeptide repeats
MANRDHLVVFEKGVDAWNSWRKEHPDIKPDLDGVDAKKKDLQAINLQETSLKGADFSKSNLTAANLCKANATGADFSGGTLHGADLSETCLNNSQFIRAKMRLTKFWDSVAMGVDFTEAEFYNPSADSANFSESIFCDAEFYEICSRKTNFKLANMQGASFYRGLLLEGQFCEANLARANFNNLSIIATDFSDCNLASAKFYDVSFKFEERLVYEGYLREMTYGVSSLFHKARRVCNLHLFRHD